MVGVVEVVVDGLVVGVDVGVVLEVVVVAVPPPHAQHASLAPIP